MHYTQPDRETVDQLARETGLDRLYTTGADEHGLKWTLSVVPVAVREKDGGAAWIMTYLAELARHLGIAKRFHPDLQDVLDVIDDDQFSDDHSDPREQAANDARKKITRKRARL